jgi:ubiquinone/menaquinone biosynthesis C-methylase UbiE
MSGLRRCLASEAERQQHAWGHVLPERWRAVQTYKRGTVLDVGCSNGVYVRRLREEGTISYGIDLLRGSDWQELPDVFLLADARHLPLADQSFDTIISFETLEHVPGPNAVLKEFRRVCRHNIIISVPNCETPPELRSAGFTFHHWIDRTHINFFTLDTIRQTVEQCGFRVTYSAWINAVFPAMLLLTAFGVPYRIAHVIGRLVNKVTPKRYAMGLLVVADRI